MLDGNAKDQGAGLWGLRDNPVNDEGVVIGGHDELPIFEGASENLVV